MFPDLLIQAIVVLAIAGLLLWALSQFPIDAMVANLIRVTVIVAICIYLIYLLMGFTHTPMLRH